MSIKLAMELIFAGIEDGGGTFDRNGNKIEQTKGFVVGGKRPSLIIRLPRYSGIIEATERVAEWLDDQPFYSYGSWVDEGYLHIDAVDIYLNRENAIHAGIMRNQISIWDIEKGEEIRLGQ